MKKLIFLLSLLLAVSLVMESCNHSSPKVTAKKFLEAVKNNNYEEAKKYATKDSEQMLNMLSSFSSVMPQSYKDKMRNSHIDIKDVQEKDGIATVTYVNSEEKKEETLQLKKVEGKWKVVLSKDNMMPDVNSMPGADSTMMMPLDSSLQQ